LGMRIDTTRFWSKVVKSEGCWCWIGTIRARNCKYGVFSHKHRYLLAHRVSYALIRGEIPKGLTIDHLCRNTLCVNPEHLEAVTMKENTLRGMSPIAKNARKTQCLRGHPFNAENTYWDKRGRRSCKTCQAARSLTKECKAAQRLYRRKHIREFKAYDKRYYKENRDALRAYRHKWYLANSTVKKRRCLDAPEFT
jgi:HNH endonuclease